MSSSFRPSKQARPGRGLTLLLVVAMFSALLSPANASLDLVKPDPTKNFTFRGHGGYSADGLGQIGTGATIQAEVPAGSTVKLARLYGTYVSGTKGNLSLAERTINFDGTNVVLTEMIQNEHSSIGTAVADVTNQVAAKVAGAGPVYNFAINNDPERLDGVGLVVVYESASLPEVTVYVLEGGLSSGGQTTTVTFPAPITKGSGFAAKMSLGIGFGCQTACSFDAPQTAGTHECGTTDQRNIIITSSDGTSQRLTSCAGNYDDGFNRNGALITVGGVGDSTTNPTDPFATSSPAGDDDELYDLSGFIGNGTTSFQIENKNPSGDDNIFLSVISVTTGLMPVLTVDESSIRAGAESVPLTSIPPSKLNEVLSQLADQLESAPASSPLISIPLISIDIASSPLISIPLISIGLDKTPPGTDPLNNILLSSIPIDWAPILAGRPGLDGLPLQTLTLANVRADATAWSRFTSLTLGQAGLSSTLLNGSRLTSILFGGITLNRITTDANLNAVNWCPDMNAVGSACTSANLSSTSVAGLDIAGAPLISIPLISIPLISIQGGLAGSPLISIPLISIPTVLLERVVDCTKINCSDPSKTFGDAEAAGALRPGGSMADIVLGLLINSDFPWEKIRLTGRNPLEPGVQDFAGTGDILHYAADFDFTCGASPDPTIAVKVQLPNEFQYVRNSTKVVYGEGSPKDVSEPVLSVDTGFPNAVKWSLPAGGCAGMSPGTIQHVHLTFSALAGLTLGTFTSKIHVEANGQTGEAFEQAPVAVTENGEPNNDPAMAPIIPADTLIIGHLPTSTDRDFFQFPIPAQPNSRVKVFLSHLSPGQDFDLSLFKENAQPLQSSPLISIPLISIPMEDTGSDTNNTQDPLPPETLQDIPLISIPLISISANRENADEFAQVVTRGEGGSITIQVSGYNGSHGPHPYVLRVKVSGPVALPPTCPARTFPFDPDPYAGADEAVNAPVPPAAGDLLGKETAFVLFRNRLNDFYGAAATNDLLAKLNTLAARPEVKGVVIQADGNLQVKNALMTWDAEGGPCSIELANDVVRKVNSLMGSLTGRDNLKHVVLVGSDEAGPPMARVPDLTTVSPEFDNASNLAFTTDNFTKGNALYTSSALGYVLTDDAYVSWVKTDWLGRELFLPFAAVGRVVETPKDIMLQVDQYIASNGTLDPTTADTKSLVTGYDFLRDGSDETHSFLAPLVPAGNAKKLNDPFDSWTRKNLVDEFTGAKPPPKIAAINAHYDHYRLLPAAPAAPTTTDLFTTADIPPPSDPLITPTLAGRLLFSVGCHGGLNVANTLIGAPTADQRARLKDWAEAYAIQRAAVYFANTGFGYGDTKAVALSERLMSIFASKLSDGSTTIGQKGVDAKHDYFLTMGTYGVYDEKALIEATMYGFPFYRFGSFPAASAPTSPTLVSDPTYGGPESASFLIDPVALTRVDDSRGSFWIPSNLPDRGQVQFAHNRPIQPRFVRNATVADKRTGGVVIRELSTKDVVGVNPRLAKPTIDLLGSEQEPSFRDTPYPANFVNTTRSRSARGERQNVVLLAGQFRPNPDNPTFPTGTERLVTQFRGDALYVPSGSTDVTPPRISFVEAITVGSTAMFTVRATDDSPNLNAAVLYKVGAGVCPNPSETGCWQYLKLDPTATPGQFTGSAMVLSSNIEVMAQAWDGGANVSYSTNKASFHSAKADVKPPTVRIDSPQNGAVFTLNQVVNASFTCSDDTGVTSCAGSQKGPSEASFTPVANDSPIDTSKLGQHEFKVEATDASGASSSLTHLYFVQYSFEGFFPPVDNNKLNSSLAGQGIPVKWRLRDANGAFIRDLTVVSKVQSSRINCNSGLPEGQVEELTTVGLSVLTYDLVAEQYRFGWDTKKEWKGTCRRFELFLNDGTLHTADFIFK